MNLILLHGYLLQGTGSNIYAANVARAWSRQGHAVTVICQDLQAGALKFVDEYVGPGGKLPPQPPAPATIRVVVPDINKLLPVYVLDRYAGFQVKTIPAMTTEEIENHISMTAEAVRQCALQGVDGVLANHALFGPVIAKRALQNRDISFDVKIHGSAIEYTLIPYPEFMPYAIEGLEAARRVFVGSRYIQKRVNAIFSKEREALDLERKIVILPPGIDPELFKPDNDHKALQNKFLATVKERVSKNRGGRHSEIKPVAADKPPDELHQELVRHCDTYDQRAVDADLIEKWPFIKFSEPVVIYFGKFLAAKGVGEIIAAIPAILACNPALRFVFVGFGSYREHMEGMLRALGSGDAAAFTTYARAGNFVDSIDPLKWFRPLSSAELSRITITGILDHDAIGPLLSLASICLVPSKVPEAFGMVAVEAMSAGVLPLCNYHAGLKDVVDAVATDSPEIASIMVLELENFFDQLPDKIQSALAFLYPHGFDEPDRSRSIGKRLRQIAVDNFSWQEIGFKLLPDRQMPE